MNILYVEDNDDIAFATKLNFKDRGVQSVHTKSIEGVLDEINNDFDGYLLDGDFLKKCKVFEEAYKEAIEIILKEKGENAKIVVYSLRKGIENEIQREYNSNTIVGFEKIKVPIHTVINHMFNMHECM